jgi:uncharacterized protein YdeI (BOF family)
MRMRIRIGLVTLAALLGVGTLSHALDPQGPPPRAIDPAPISGAPVIEGDVLQVDPDSYLIRDLSGRDVRVYFDPATTRDNINVGDHVIVRFNQPSARYATSITRGRADVTAGALPRPQTVEGEILRINTDNYVIRDVSGKEVRIHVDRTTKLDGNLTPGDKVVARLVAPPSNAIPYAQTVYKLNSPQALEGQVVAIDGTTYVVRDLNGVEHRVSADSATSGVGTITTGDRVVIVKGNVPMAHAESVTKR